MIEKIKNKLSFLLNLYRDLLTWKEIIGGGNFKFLRFSGLGHFYNPIPDAREVDSNAERIFELDVDYLDGIDIRAEHQMALIDSFESFIDEMSFPQKKGEVYRYYFDNPFFSYGDGVILYSIMRVFKPSRIIEVGSGFSSAEMLDVSEKYFGGRVDFVFIDPYPDRLVSLLSDEDVKRVRIVQKKVQDVDLSLYEQLGEDDILFIDSSHVTKVDSDVMHLIFNVFPVLKKRVLIHIHDILWPFEYPRIWLEEGRAWNEAYMLRAYLTNNPNYEIVYFNSYMEKVHKRLVGEFCPLALSKPTSSVTPSNSSIWLRKVA